jgi:hypothetical protein
LIATRTAQVEQQVRGNQDGLLIVEQVMHSHQEGSDGAGDKQSGISFAA